MYLLMVERVVDTFDSKIFPIKKGFSDRIGHKVTDHSDLIQMLRRLPIA